MSSCVEASLYNALYLIFAVNNKLRVKAEKSVMYLSEKTLSEGRPCSMCTDETKV
jgi:hypothetical protein